MANKKRTNVWDYLSKVAKQRTKRVQARNETTQVKVQEGVDNGSLLSRLANEYGDDLINIAAGGLSAYTGVPLGTVAPASPTAAPIPTPTTTAAPATASTDSYPSWLLPAGVLAFAALIWSRK